MQAHDEADFWQWVDALFERHQKELSFQEIRRGLCALSDVYVHKRQRLGNQNLKGRGKQAAFACYYTPLHYLMMRHVLSALDIQQRVGRIVDLGAGTGAGGLAWADHQCQALGGPKAHIHAIDRDPWALGEGRQNLMRTGYPHQTKRGDMVKFPMAPQEGGQTALGICALYAVNELDDTMRQKLLARLLQAHDAGAAVIVLEPIAKTISPWWQGWQKAFEERGGVASEWKYPVRLRGPLQLLGKAAGLNHSVLKARSLSLLR